MRKGSTYSASGLRRFFVRGALWAGWHNSRRSTMSRLAKLKEQLGAEFDRAEAISDIAAKEKRDLTAEEKASIDAIMGIGKKGDAT